MNRAGNTGKGTSWNKLENRWNELESAGKSLERAGTG